ncbi:MAG: nitrilase [Robiginitomaculum sp.]|nr:MAG: nitrilase [Robiginitomaculum sp.]
MSKTIIKGAVVQAGTCLYDTPRTLDKFEDLLADAARQGAQLTVFPEAFIGGYPKGADFGARVGSRTPAGREDYQRYYNSAIALDGPELARMSKAVAKANVNVVVGVMEQGGATLYCTALYFAKDGTLMGKHRKLMPTAMERLIWGFGDGSTLAVQNMDVGKVGALICWENYMPLARTHMYAQGVEFYCSPTVDDRPAWTPSMQHIAIEGRCFVLSAVQYMRRSDAPDDYICADGDAPDTVLINGGSCIVSPFGELLAGPVFGEDTILTADLDKSLITRGKYDLDTVGHYARPDVFSLHVNTAPQNAVVEEE